MNVSICNQCLLPQQHTILFKRSTISRPLQRSIVARSSVLNNGAVTHPSPSMDVTCPTPPGAALDFLMLMQQLKVNKRTGWVRRGVEGAESIADHMYRMAVMALLFAGTDIDYQRCVMMAVVHDMAEAIVGDITPHCGVSPEEKKRLEAEAVQRMVDMLGPNTQAAVLIEELWREYEGAATPCAQLVKDFDKVEMILQAWEYEMQHNTQLQEFYESTRGKFKTAAGQAWAAEIAERRRQYWQQRTATQPADAAPSSS